MGTLIGGGSISHRHLREQMDRFQEDLTKIPGVRTARVVGEDAPTEIHIVSASGRSPKQVVRDVQSLATAGFGLTIDHRIVSVVQIEENGEPRETGHRAIIEWVKMASQGQSGRIDIGLRWPQGETSGGAHTSASTREARARAAAEAVVHALTPILDERDATVEIEAVIIQKLGADDSVTVKALYRDKNSAIPVLGSAIVQDDVVTATARALLHALNRKLYT